MDYGKMNFDTTFYKKIGVPEPKLSPTERCQRRFAFRNERTLYRRTCDLCKASIISIYSPDKPLTVYCQKCWWGDEWSAENFGRDFNFNRPFFEQFSELLKKVPRYSLYNVNGLNSEYCQQVVDNKNCYLCFVMKGCESCMYISHAVSNKDCMDSMYLRQSELCYECLDSDHLYNCDFCEHCRNSSDLKFCYDCMNCQNCFGCYGLRNKQFYWFNKPFTKDEYGQRLRGLALNTPAGIEKAQKEFEAFKITKPHRNLWMINTENSSGNNIQNTRDCFECYDGFELQDCTYCIWTFRNKDCMDCYGMGDSELVYESIGDEEVHRCAFTTFVTRSSDIWYSDSCFSSHNCFGCAGMKNAKYAIFNKKYDKEAYDKLMMTIVEHMKKTGEYGEFFPMEISPFRYNETIAQDHFPL